MGERDEGDLKMYQAKSGVILVGWGGGGVPKNRSCPEWPETHFGFRIFEIHEIFQVGKFFKAATSNHRKCKHGHHKSLRSYGRRN